MPRKEILRLLPARHRLQPHDREHPPVLRHRQQILLQIHRGPSPALQVLLWMQAKIMKCNSYLLTLGCVWSGSQKEKGKGSVFSFLGPAFNLKFSLRFWIQGMSFRLNLSSLKRVRIGSLQGSRVQVMPFASSPIRGFMRRPCNQPLKRFPRPPRLPGRTEQSRIHLSLKHKRILGLIKRIDRLVQPALQLPLLTHMKSLLHYFNYVYLLNLADLMNM